MNEKEYNIKAAVFGHAVGDALGVPAEFMSREELMDNPVTDMRGFGTYPYPPGTWSDDTSMTLACLDSLMYGIDYNDIMQKFFEWFNRAEYTATGEVFDIGSTTRKSIMNYFVYDMPALQCGQTSIYDNGNGSLVRIIPIVLYLYYSELNSCSVEKKINYIHNVSALTHGHLQSQTGCGIYAFIMWELLKNKSKSAVYDGLANAKKFYEQNPEITSYARVLNIDVTTISINRIYGSGYVIDCLEAALWCLLTTDSYKDCVLKAVSLGDDADTTAAVAGGLAGVLYGYESIPQKWIDTLARTDYIKKLCENAAMNW